MALYIASELLIPAAASWYVKREIKKRYPSVTDISVSVRSFPAFLLLFKKYSHLKLTARRITLEEVTFDQIELASSRFPDATFEAVIGQSEINRFFTLSSSYLENPGIIIEQDRLRVSGGVDVGFGTIDAVATGTLDARGGREVYFQPRTINVEGLSMPSTGVGLVRGVMGGRPLFTVRQDLPFTISEIAAEQGKLKIRGNVDLEKALKVSL